MYYSCREPKFGSQYPYQAAYKHKYTHACIHAHTYTQRLGDADQQGKHKLSNRSINMVDYTEIK